VVGWSGPKFFSLERKAFSTVANRQIVVGEVVFGDDGLPDAEQVAKHEVAGKPRSIVVEEKQTGKTLA